MNKTHTAGSHKSPMVIGQKVRLSKRVEDIVAATYNLEPGAVYRVTEILKTARQTCFRLIGDDAEGKPVSFAATPKMVRREGYGAHQGATLAMIMAKKFRRSADEFMGIANFQQAKRVSAN